MPALSKYSLLTASISIEDKATRMVTSLAQKHKNGSQSYQILKHVKQINVNIHSLPLGINSKSWFQSIKGHSLIYQRLYES